MQGKTGVGGSEPPAFAFPVVRTRVIEEWVRDLPQMVKLSCVVAPTGYGKTSLAATLINHCQSEGIHSHWIALDDRDQSMERVLGALEAAVGHADAEFHPTQALLRGDEPIENRIDALADAMARLPDPSLILIDNLGYCTDETLGYLLDRLVFRTSSSVKFMFCSTHRIPMNLARAKIEGWVREVGIAELSLDAGEVRDLLGISLCDKLGPSGVETVFRHTEGWPAAVRLAQIILSASKRPLEALAQFSGADRDLADLLNRQVLAGFRPETRQFLLELSLLRRFCVELAGHATGDGQAAAHVDDLLQRNVFVIPLDRNRSWYRLHGLFREFLTQEAQRTLSDAHRQAVLERAAQWCERGGHWQDGIDYAIASGSIALASTMIERVAPLFVRDQGNLRQFIEWVDKLRSGGHEVGWEADYWYVWALVFHRRYEYARRQANRLAQRVQEQRAVTQNPRQWSDLQRRVEVIGNCIDLYVDRLDDAHGRATRWLAEQGTDDPFDRATIGCVSAICQTAAYRFAEARSAMRTAQAAIGQADSAYGAGWVAVLGNMILMAEGDYATAHQDLLAALSRVRLALGEGTGIAATISLAAAKCAVEMGLDDEARSLLSTNLHRAQSHGILDTAAVGLDAAVKLWSGQAEDSISISQLREIAGGYPPRLGLMLSCFVVQRLIRLGRLDDALAEGGVIGLGVHGAEARGRPFDGLQTERSRELYGAAQIDLLMAVGQIKQAEALVQEQHKLAKRDGCVARQVELVLCEVAIAVCSHNPLPATGHLTRALSLAARRGIRRPFRDRGELIAGLVNHTKPAAWTFALEEERKFFIEICRGLPLTHSSLLNELEQFQGYDNRLMETPTGRELELLKLIEAGFSNQQLADRLNVSVATVKWHLYNLYNKLGVSSRSAALARAKFLNLLSR